MKVWQGLLAVFQNLGSTEESVSATMTVCPEIKKSLVWTVNLELFDVIQERKRNINIIFFCPVTVHRGGSVQGSKINVQASEPKEHKYSCLGTRR